LNSGDAAVVRRLLGAAETLRAAADARTDPGMAVDAYCRAASAARALPFVSGPPADGLIRIDWAVTAAEWEEIASVLLGHGDFPVIHRMIAAGAVPDPFPADRGPSHGH
jgi:hypothetical protein